MLRVSKSTAGNERLFSIGHQDSKEISTKQLDTAPEEAVEDNTPQTVDIKIFEQLQKGITITQL